MQCLLVAATVAEIAPLTRHFKQIKGRKSLSPDILITGVGMLPATWHITKYLSVKKPGLIIQAGIAGCFNPDIPLTKVYAVRSEIMADVGVQEHGVWRDVFDLGLCPPSGFPFSRRELRNPHKQLLKNTGLPLARAITVNTISSGKKLTLQRYTAYKPLLESMEGAALHFAALQEAIPFIQVRSVSNYVGERNKKNWQIPAAIETLNEALLHIFKTL
jgi:futalosine hydrolase